MVSRMLIALNGVVWRNCASEIRPHCLISRVASVFLLFGAVSCADGAPSHSIGEPGGWSLQSVAFGSGESAELDRPLLVRSGPGGLLYIASQRLSGLPMVMDSSGNFIRTLGRRGEGPGEFQYVSQIYPKADSVVVTDIRGAAALFDGSGRFVRAFGAPRNAITQVILLRGDTLLLPAAISTEERFGLPLHLIAPTGDTARSFGADDRTINPKLAIANHRVVAPQSDTTFWVARIDRYEIERWHINGTRLQVLQAKRPWFVARTQDWDGTFQTTPPSRVKQIHQARSGHLFVVLERARADWSPTPDSDSRRESSEGNSLIAQMKQFEHVVEVLEPESGALLASIPSEGTYLINFVDDDRLLGLVAGPDGEELLVIFRVVPPSINGVREGI